MLDQIVYAAAARSPRLVVVTSRAGQLFAEAYCLPPKVQDGLDTAKLWTTIIAIAMGVIALLMIAVGMFFQHRRGDGGEVLKSLGWWIGGAVLMGSASGIATVFLGSATQNCQQLPS